MRFRSEPGPRAADSGVFRRPGDAIEHKGLVLAAGDKRERIDLAEKTPNRGVRIGPMTSGKHMIRPNRHCGEPGNAPSDEVTCGSNRFSK